MTTPNESEEDFPIVCGDGWRITRVMSAEGLKIYASLVLDELRQISDAELCSFPDTEDGHAEWHRTFYLLQAYARYVNAQGDHEQVAGLPDLFVLFREHQFRVDWPLLITTQEVEQPLFVYRNVDTGQKLVVIEDEHQEILAAEDFLDEIGMLQQCEHGTIVEEDDNVGP